MRDIWSCARKTKAADDYHKLIIRRGFEELGAKEAREGVGNHKNNTFKNISPCGSEALNIVSSKSSTICRCLHSARPFCPGDAVGKVRAA